MTKKVLVQLFLLAGAGVVSQNGRCHSHFIGIGIAKRLLDRRDHYAARFSVDQHDPGSAAG